LVMGASVKTLLRIALFLAVVVAPSGLWAGPFDSCADNLPFGEPHLVKSAETTAICHVGYAVLHDDKFLVPRWVAYRLTGPHTLGCLARTNNFHADDNLPNGKRAMPDDYSGSGFDQGHQAPAQDFAWNIDRMKDSFSMANMTPQLPGLNRQGWERLEETVRVWATDRNALIVYVGPILLNPKRTIGADHVVVPTAFWKVVVDPATGDALAFIMPQHNVAKGKLDPWQVPISQVEQAAGIELPLPNNTDRKAEPQLWPANLVAWSQKHKDLCPTPKNKKKVVKKRKTSRKPKH
jgi:endonuclease G